MTFAETDDVRLRPNDVIYQVYLATFADSDGDGIGDLNGLTSRLDYLSALGVDWIWISPFFPSTADGGYAISNFRGVDKRFGSKADFSRLVQEAHNRGIRVLIDIVINHTSDQHPWFKASCSGDPRYRDFYIWHPGGGPSRPPNNWFSTFCGNMPDGQGSAWYWEQQRGEWSLASFLKQQRDLNWFNPAVRRAIRDVLRFWFKVGADGARVDVPQWAAKDLWEFRDNPAIQGFAAQGDPDWYHSQVHLFDRDLPWVLEIYRWLDAAAKEFPGRIIVTETYPPNLADPGGEYRAIFGRHTPGLSAPFALGIPYMDFTAANLRDYASTVHSAMRPGDQIVWVVGNHDVGRVAGRIGRDLAPAAAVIQLVALPGPACIYGGEETGMVQEDVPDDLGQDERRLRGAVSRDSGRLPMVWDSLMPGGGFTTSDRPYLPIISDPGRFSVATQASSPRSLLALYRQLILLRRHEPELGDTSFAVMHDERHPDLFVCVRGQRLFVAANLGTKPGGLAHIGGQVRILARADGGATGSKVSAASLVLGQGEAVVMRSVLASDADIRPPPARGRGRVSAQLALIYWQ